jgi:Leucine-rich repeat (LRR) protein
MREPLKFQYNKELVIDPSIIFDNILDELIDDFKIKLISYADDPVILENLVVLMYRYLNDNIIDEILLCCFTKETIKGIKRDYKIKTILK